MGEIDLEALAGGYGHRLITGESLARAAAAADAAGLAPGTLAIDVGGGRGDHAAVFAARGANVVVVDRSSSMARSSAGRDGVAAVVGDAGSLPVRGGIADLVYSHLSLHYGDWRQNLDEASRVVREGGSVWIWTLAAGHAAGSYLARWFPSVAEIDRQRFPDPDGVAAYLAERGCGEVVTGSATERVERTAGTWRAAVQAGFVSTLQLVDLGEVENGLRRHAAEHPDPAEPVAYDLPYVSIAAVRPSLR